MYFRRNWSSKVAWKITQFFATSFLEQNYWQLKLSYRSEKLPIVCTPGVDSIVKNWVLCVILKGPINHVKVEKYHADEKFVPILAGWGHHDLLLPIFSNWYQLFLYILSTSGINFFLVSRVVFNILNYNHQLLLVVFCEFTTLRYGKASLNLNIFIKRFHTCFKKLPYTKLHPYYLKILSNLV